MRLFADEEWSGTMKEPVEPDPPRPATDKEPEEYKKKLKEKSK